LPINQTEETPIPVQYLPVVPGVRVGCGILELADRMTVTREEGGGPKVKKERVLSVTIDGDIVSKGEAMALAAALQAFGEKLE